MLCCLRCPAPGNDDGLVFLISSGRPNQVIVCPTPDLVLPASPILVEIIDRWRIGVTVVESSDLRGDFGYCRMLFVCSSHSEFAAVMQCAQTVAILLMRPMHDRSRA